MVTIEIDKDSGFCFGVVNAIRKAERELDEYSSLYCLGDIVHNTGEVKRLEEKGMVTIDYAHLGELADKRVLFRAHGEPPEVYLRAREKGICIVDATCPVVLRLQRKIKESYDAHMGEKWQIVIFGKRGHAEVNGLVGQTQGKAWVIEEEEDLEYLDFSAPIELFSQTTQSLEAFRHLISLIKSRMGKEVPFIWHDTICRQVALRIPQIASFAQKHDYIFFIAGKKSSNGKALFQECLKVNPQSLFLSDSAELTREMLPEDPYGMQSIGICGATSTPRSQMEELATRMTDLLFGNSL